MSGFPNLQLHPALQIWLNSVPKNQQSAAINNALLAATKIPQMERDIDLLKREIQRLKGIMEEQRD